MSIETYNHTADIATIEKIEFCVYSNEEVKRYSVINDRYGIVISEAYENGEPKQGGLIDKRLGVTEQHIYCDTCGLMTNDCPGHFGHTELAEEVFHFGYLDIVKGILNCICLQCSKVLITKDEEEILEILGNSHGKNRFAKMKKLTSNVKFCQRQENNCGKPVGKISKEITKSGSIQLIVTHIVDSKLDDIDKSNVNLTKKKKNIEYLPPSKVYNILKNIDDNDCKLLGFDPIKNRPESFIIKNFPIPPVAIRPSVRLGLLSSGPSEDGLTAKLADIVKDNGRLKKQKDKTLITGEESKYNLDYQQLLQFDIATYYDNESTLPKTEQKGKASKSVSERLKGKTGRIRGNLMGKRVDFSARTVITSDPNINLDELGVPIKIAINLTFPEVVTDFNIDKLSKLVKNGRDIYPGANFILPLHSLELGKKSKIDLRYRKRSIKLHNGDIVERHIIDNDPVLFNRQPSLHKMSMMCHRIKVIKNESLNTFRLNVTATTPYNADFDGDEMNMFVPQSVQAQLEIANIADIKRQIISPRHSNPIVVFKQDTVLGTYNMTYNNKIIKYNDAMNLAMNCKNINMFQIEKKDTDTHKLYSLIIPPMINYKNNKVNINNGTLIDGIIGSSILNKKIIYYSWDRHGPDITKDLFDNAQRLVSNWLLMNGFSVGLGDATIANKNVIKDIQSFCYTKKMEIDKLITEIENNPDTLDPNTFETNIKSSLLAYGSEITQKINNHLKTEEPTNNFHIMIESGAKGKIDNIGHIIGGLGQNVLDGNRIKKKVNNRTLPHFFQNDDRAFARGFIQNSYYQGLTPTEFFFHHITAREGMIDTAIKTSDSGYLQRKLIKGMEDIIITYDKTVRSGNNVIIQMIYGDNNINQTFYKEVEIKLVKMSNTEIINIFGFEQSQLENLAKEFKLDNTKLSKWNDDLINYTKYIRDDLRQIQMKSKLSYITIQNLYQLPVNLSRIIDDAKNIDIDLKQDRLHPFYIIHAINYILLPEITKVNILDKGYDTNSIKFNDQRRSKYLFKIALLEYLSPKRCIFEYKLTKQQFDQLICDIIISFGRACVEPGEMVGILTAQSLGETLTQMTLNTFHSSGVGVMGMQGIPRFREILSYSKNIQTPFMMIRLTQDVRSNHTIAHKIEADLKYTIFQNVVERMDIIYDPITVDIIKKDNINTNNIYYFGSSNISLENIPWLYRYKISRESMLENDITLLDIKTKFMKYWDEFINESTTNKKKNILSRVLNGCIMSNFDNSESPIIHIRFDISNPDNYSLIEIGQYLLNKITIKGVSNIKMVDRVDKQKVIEYDEDKGIKLNTYEWVLYTSGIDLDKIKTNKYIDFNSVYINDIHSIYLNFGIEAARNLIQIESDRLYNGSSNPLNITHASLLADVMTNTGKITSIDRHGLNRLDTDPLSRASFEKTVEQLIMAAAFNEVDHMRSVSSRIMAGRCFKGGTGICEVLIDNDLIENSEYNNQINEVLNLKKDSIEINTAIDSFNKFESNDDDIFIP